MAKYKNIKVEFKFKLKNKLLNRKMFKFNLLIHYSLFLNNFQVFAPIDDTDAAAADASVD